MKTKLKVIIIGSALTLMAIIYLFFPGKQLQNHQVSLAFQRYSKPFLDPDVDRVAFLWLTNASKQSYLLSMVGKSNTVIADIVFGGNKESCMVNCEFSDQTANGWTNSIQQPSASISGNSYLSFGPRSGLIVRVPLPPKGQHRKVAVLCEVPPATPPFWISRFGFLAYRMLPQSLKDRVIHPSPVLLKIWCDRELSSPSDDIEEK